MSKHSHDQLDNLQLFFLGVCTFDLIFFVCYMLLYEVDSQSMISDTLFTTPEYAVVLTFTLAVRLLGASMFLYRYRYIFPFWEIVGYVGVLLAMFGWAWLVLHKDNTNHFLGVGLFCVGSSLYSISFVLLAGRTHQHLRAVHNALLAFLLLSTCALALAFILLWRDEEAKGQHSASGGSQNAYIVEHVAYITHVLFYATFFLYHSPDITKSPHVFSTYEQNELIPELPGEEEYDGESGAHPLLPRSSVIKLAPA